MPKESDFLQTKIDKIKEELTLRDERTKLMKESVVIYEDRELPMDTKNAKLSPLLEKIKKLSIKIDNQSV
ncbi:MAG: Unknown protein [uncultured Sulfurovum sp.]|uniref:Uncharacterized protein n=1 Tax=uncultured Sulfurovum sp. TaxID=269237 RepID=A0A6S6SQK4_9BACT|nr:MAG: Unknown protein [uncultured Sulfurovum sp.]